MFHRHVELYLHIIWSTWDRVPWIADGIRAQLHSVIASVGHRQGCSYVVVGGADDHVHVLVRAPPTVVPSTFVGEIKGASSHFAHAELGIDPSLRWSSGYALFSVEPQGVTALTRYIHDQPRHHLTGSVALHWELPNDQPLASPR